MQPGRPSRLGLFFRIHDRLLPVALNVPARRRITYAKETASKAREAAWRAARHFSLWVL
jgi:hypothetical protein